MNAEPREAAGPSYRVLKVGGADATAFLQGQLTQDLSRPGPLLLAGLLSPQGRVVVLAWLARSEGGWLLVLPAALAENVRTRLSRYVLRSKVNLELAPLEAPLERAIAATLAPDARLDPLALVRAGIASIDAAGSEEWIAQMLNLDLVGAISFEKGCYTGQEIVARTQHLGRIKRRLFHLGFGAGPVPAAKAAIVTSAGKVGEVVSAAATPAGVECLAVVNLDARDAPLATEDGRACTVLPLPYPIP